MSGPPSLLSAPCSTRHPDDEYVDEITIRTIPRWKTSGLSGDEWRVSAAVEFWRKGNLVWVAPFSDIETATKALPWFFRVFGEGPDGRQGTPQELMEPRTFYRVPDEIDLQLCFQPGCKARAAVEYTLKKQFSRREGFEGKSTLTLFRRFCAKHAERGDCDLEDADRNYERTDWKPEAVQ